MATLNLIDPNEIVLGNNHPFKGTGLGIPDVQDIRSFVELTLRPRNTNYIEIQDDSATLDRVDNAQGYIKGNGRVISWKANKAKGCSTADELRKIIQYIEGNKTV